MNANGSNLTVVMATYNGARYLEQQLASLEDQIVQPSRLIASDDGSGDDTRQILASFAKQASFDVTIIDGAADRGHHFGAGVDSSPTINSAGQPVPSDEPTDTGHDHLNRSLHG